MGDGSVLMIGLGFGSISVCSLELSLLRVRLIEGLKVIVKSSAVMTFPPFPLPCVHLSSKTSFAFSVSSATSPSLPLSHFSSSSLADVALLHPCLGL